jgi:hypothetical protein
MMAPAMIRFQAGGVPVPSRGISPSRPMTTTLISRVLVIIKGQRYRFHPKVNTTTKRAAMFVQESGRRIDQRKPIGPAPLSCAA